jgi:hypothetical protein
MSFDYFDTPANKVCGSGLFYLMIVLLGLAAFGGIFSLSAIGVGVCVVGMIIASYGVNGRPIVDVLPLMRWVCLTILVYCFFYMFFLIAIWFFILPSSCGWSFLPQNISDFVCVFAPIWGYTNTTTWTCMLIAGCTAIHIVRMLSSILPAEVDPSSCGWRSLPTLEVEETANEPVLSTSLLRPAADLAK